MPLPSNSSISLQGHSRPGEGMTTMPKIAMVVRMTGETLDALQGLSGADKMDFEFGDKPGIYVRDQFFPMRYDKEKENQELFIRTTMPARPNAPLRLNANVVGKFAVEKVLSDKLSQRMHNATAAALKQKAERKAIMVDNPPPGIAAPVAQKPAPKRKAPPKNVPKASSTPTIVKSYATTSPNPAASSNGSSSVALPKELATQYRQRLIHYLALGPATVQDIFKEFGGSEIDHNTRAGIMDLIHDVAEREEVPRKSTSTSQPATWRLKPQTWLEVRPYQYSGYTDNVRTRVARMARSWFVSLKIPEDDPAWDHVKFRDSGHGNTSANTSAQRAVNGTTSAAAKKAKKSTKATNAEVKVKSEAVAPQPRPSQVPASLPPKPSGLSMRASTPIHSTKGKEREIDTEKEEGEISASQTPPQMSSAPPERRQPNQRPSSASTPTMPPPPVPVSSQSASSAAAKRTGPVDARGPRRPPPSPSERARAAPPLPPPPAADRKPVVQIKKEVVAQPKKERPSSSLGENRALGVNGASQSSKERDRELARRERERDRESDRESIRMARKERERERESDRESIRGREKERALKERELARERAQERKLKEKDLTTSRSVAKTTTSTATKRRASESSDEESSDWGYEDRRRPAKLKHRESIATKSSSSSLKVPKRESSPLVVKQKVKREASPLHLAKSKSVPAERKAVATGSSKVSSSTIVKKEPKVEGVSRSMSVKPHKRRRPSIDYTSSSEEEEERKPKVLPSTTKSTAISFSTKNSSSTTSSAALNNHNHNHSANIARSHPAKPRPTLSGRDQLRSRYSSLYGEYIMVFQKLVAHKHKAEAMLRHGSESPSGAESDVDTSDLMPLDEVQELKVRHQKLHDELEKIQKSFAPA